MEKTNLINTITAILIGFLIVLSVQFPFAATLKRVSKECLKSRVLSLKATSLIASGETRRPVLENDSVPVRDTPTTIYSALSASAHAFRRKYRDSPDAHTYGESNHVPTTAIQPERPSRSQPPISTRSGFHFPSAALRFVPTLATIDGVKISAVIIAFNEEENIAKAVESVSWADEIIVVDSESTDRTREIAEALGTRVIIRKWTGFSEQKQFAVDQAANDWIFSLDADEIVSPELKEEILSLNTSRADGFRIPRLSFYMGRAIRHSGWYPDRQLRLYDRTKGRWKKVHIHESVEMERGTRLSELKHDILHFSVKDASHHHRMIGERYAPLAAEQMFEKGKRTTPLKIAFAGPAAFCRAYFLKLGFLDGLPGFTIASFASHHAFLKHLLLWEKQNSETRPG